MSSRELYRRFLSLCRKWPTDEQKAGRDYGEMFRRQFSAKFPQGELSSVDLPRELDKSLSALERLANNSYYNENPLQRSSASGLEAWACREAVSNESLRLFQEEEEVTILSRLKQALSIRFSGLAPHKSTKDS